MREGGVLVERATGAGARRGRVEKMSKSKKNTVDPEPILDRYGADAVRWFMLSDSAPGARPRMVGKRESRAPPRFVQRVWRLVQSPAGNEGEDLGLAKKLHRTIAAVGEAIEGLQFNKSVAALYELTSAIEKAAPSATRDEAIRTLLLLIAPGAPHLAEEAWAARGEAGMIADARLAGLRSGDAGRRRGYHRRPGQRQAARDDDRAARISREDAEALAPRCPRSSRNWAAVLRAR